MILTGAARIGKDAELRYTPNGTAVANLALCFNHGQKQTDGNRLSQWIDAALWGKQAEALLQYLVKGSQVSVVIDGPHIEFYKKNDGTQQSKLVGNIINIEFVGKKSDSGTQPQAAQRQGKPAGNQGGNPYDDNFEDIPF
jgi:single-strand DNA-binding protein